MKNKNTSAGLIGVHVTHEAIQKIGGIGTVLHGLIGAKTYQKAFPETLLYTPMFNCDGKCHDRLGEDSLTLYSSIDGVDEKGLKKTFSPIEEKHRVKIAFGKKSFLDEKTKKVIATVDICAVDIWNMRDETVRAFKFRLWEHFGIQSDAFVHDSDYEQYLRIGAIMVEIVEALYGENSRAAVFSHEYMGMASALATLIAKMDGKRQHDLTLFYAHEVSTARMIVEKHQGHDLAFYNIMNHDLGKKISMEARFGSYSNFSRNELIKRADKLDYVFAVSRVTKDEYMYLCPEADESKVKVVFNGIRVEKMPYSEKENAMALVNGWCKSLYNFTPDHIFTHVTRLVVSKGLWRDVRMLYLLDEYFAEKNLNGFFVMLSTLVGEPRRHEDIKHMEDEYGWPVLHKKGYPDLLGAEEDLYDQLQLFNARSKKIKGVFLNQFGFSRRLCGKRVPDGATLTDLRLASDFEFGMSIYEPFGIAPLETLPFGGIPVVSADSGCANLLETCLQKDDFVSIDFAAVPTSYKRQFSTPEDFLKISKDMRDLIETESCRRGAGAIIELLPKNKAARKKRFEKLQESAKQMDWAHVASGIVEHLKMI